MQPQEPVVGGVPQPPAMPPASIPPARKPRARRGRLILAIAGGIMALLCLGGVGVFVSVYTKATEIKRTAPVGVVVDFLGAYLVNRDDREAALYQCKSGGDFSQIQAFRDDITQREKTFSVGILVTWSSLDVHEDGKSGTVTAVLTRTQSDRGGRDSSSWQFDVVDQDGWRVCKAAKLS
ncbi:hypothetical protein ODJ79_01510 [Actinoplanes sp. KI2]|uniref:hypothetical protein n=1 Tax=Actinoplanes sp. KI2 TaxID=2983315 RepID=UPI0021D5F494|nr:hypothetical protein [Actinoplanes sp. KI2]MCU7722381.1 hypothetical protein [Actinoplanes sp. KI2]